MTVTFYLSSGQTVVAFFVEKASIEKADDGSVSAWKITWEKGRAQPLFYISPKRIVAVTAKE